MKKMMLALVAMFALSSATFAQGCCKKDGEKKEVSKADFAQKRTEQMAERYGLNSDQKAKLLAVNTAFFEKYGKKCNDCPNKGQANKDCCDKKQEAKQDCCKDKKECSKKDQAAKGDKKECCKKANNGQPVAKKCDKDGKECSKDAQNKSECPKSSCDKENNKEQVKADVAKYKSDLKQIFTKEQYEKYENDIKERQERLKAAMEKKQAE